MPSLADLEVNISANTQSAESSLLNVHNKISNLGAMSGGALGSVSSGMDKIGGAAAGVETANASIGKLRGGNESAASASLKLKEATIALKEAQTANTDASNRAKDVLTSLVVEKHNAANAAAALKIHLEAEGRAAQEAASKQATFRTELSSIATHITGFGSGLVSVTAHITHFAGEVAKAGGSGLTSLVSHLDSASGKMGHLGAQASGPASSGFSNLTTKVHETNSALQTLSNTGGGALTGIINDLGRIGLAANGIKAIGTTFVGLGNTLTSSNAQLEQTKVAFTTMLGGADKADEMIGKLRNFAATTPFELKGLEGNTQKLLAFGFTSDQIIPMMTGLGNAIAGLGGTQANLDSLTFAFGQMHAAGKVHLGDLNQIISSALSAPPSIVVKATLVCSSWALEEVRVLPNPTKVVPIALIPFAAKPIRPRSLIKPVKAPPPVFDRV